MNKKSLINLGLEEDMVYRVMELVYADEMETKAAAETLNKEIKKLKSENSALRREFDSYKINSVVENALINAKAKNVKAVKALIDNENIDFKNAASAVGEQIKALKENPDTAFLFENEGVRIMGVSPAGEEADQALDVNVQNMNYSQLCAYLEENPDAQI